MNYMLGFFKIQGLDRDVNFVNKSLNLARQFGYVLKNFSFSYLLMHQVGLFHIARNCLTDQFLLRKYQLSPPPFKASLLWRITSCTPHRVWSTERMWKSCGSWRCPKLLLPCGRTLWGPKSWPWWDDAQMLLHFSCNSSLMPFSFSVVVLWQPWPDPRPEKPNCPFCWYTAGITKSNFQCELNLKYFYTYMQLLYLSFSVGFSKKVFFLVICQAFQHMLSKLFDPRDSLDWFKACLVA